MRSALVVVAAAFLGTAQPAPHRTVPRDADLIRGIDQVGFGDFESALISLRAAAQRLGREAGLEKEQALAFVYLGVAHLELDQELIAREAFADALKRDPGFRMDASQFSAQQIRVLEEVAVRIAQEKQTTARPASAATRRRPKTLPIVLGATAVGTGVALAAGGAAKPPPAASTPQPATSTNPSDIVLLSTTPASGSQIALVRGPRLASIRVRVVHDSAGQFRIGVVGMPIQAPFPALCVGGGMQPFALEAGQPVEQEIGLITDLNSCPQGTFTTTELSATLYREPGSQIVFGRRLSVSYTWLR